MPKPIKAFEKFAPPSSLESLSKNFNELRTNELERHNAMAEFDLLLAKSPQRAAQLTYLDGVIDVLKKAQLDNNRKAWILIGALLEVKRQIAASYKIRSADNSYVHANINKVIGIDADSKFDETHARFAHSELVAFMHHQEYKEAVMATVEKADYLNLKLTNDTPVTQKALSTAAMAMQRMNATSKHHVDVKEQNAAYDFMKASPINPARNFSLKKSNYYFSTDEFDYIDADPTLTENEKQQRTVQCKASISHQRQMYNMRVPIMYQPTKLRHVFTSPYHPEPILVTNEATVKEGFKNKEIYDNTRWIDNLDWEVLNRARKHEFKETNLHPMLRLFDRSKLKHVETKETHTPVVITNRR